MPQTKMEKENLPAGFKYPEEYLHFVDSQKMKNGSLNGLPPWVFAADELWALEESEQVFGVRLVPFAQAEHQDKFAYFNSQKSSEIWVANPWGEVVVNKYDNFMVWFEEIKKESAIFVVENPQYQCEFWYGNA
ncbi:MAG: hypothetical protein AB2689_27285 [Candidatus Thiodiazotropha taylori]